MVYCKTGLVPVKYLAYFATLVVLEVKTIPVC